MIDCLTFSHNIPIIKICQEQYFVKHAAKDALRQKVDTVKSIHQFMQIGENTLSQRLSFPLKRPI